MFKGLLLAAFVTIMTPIIGIAQDTPAPAPSPAPAPADTTTPPPPPPAAQEEAPAPSSSTSSSSKSSIGFKAMYGVGQLMYEAEGMTTESSDAFSFGAFWNWSTGGVVSFAIQPELHYVYESGTTTQSFFGDVTAVTESIRLPILLKLEFLTRDVVQPSVYVGPSLSYILAARSVIGDNSADFEDYEAFQAGLAFGVDVTFLRIFLVDIRYNTNFTSLVEVDPDVENGSVSMNSLRIGLGLRF